MKAGVVSLAILLLSGTFAWSQRDTSVALSPKANVFGGFVMTGGGPLGFAKGYRAGADFRVHGPLYVTIDGLQLWDKSNSRVNHVSDSADLGGLLYRHPVTKSGTALFGQVLAGAELFHNSSKSHTWTFINAWTPALEAEVGADVPLSTHWAIRPEGATSGPSSRTGAAAQEGYRRIRR